MSVAVSPQRIRKLPDTLINRIAAGEVIERPASVVKELLENSLDAGAGRVTVTVKGGGTRLIRVEDDGHGIHKGDLLLAIDRHTTSKLNDSDDLARIRTLGFRGEALSSIAAVSRFTITSCCRGDEHAWSLSNGKPGMELQPAAHPTGTTIEVRDLFHNVPARRKFLRTETTELLHIQEIVRRIALSRDSLSLRFLHNDRQLLLVTPSASDAATRAAAVYGRSFVRDAHRVEYRAPGLSLSGWLGTPDQARSQTDRQYFYINGRAVRDRQVSHAVRQAMEDRLYPGRHPVYILYLEMEPEAVDVNVHPGKQEVRFRRPRDVHDFIYSALTGALNGTAPADDRLDSLATGPSPRPAGSQPVEDGRGRYRSSPACGIENGKRTAGKLMVVCEGEFLLAETGKELVLIDIPKARELLTWSRLCAALKEGTLRKRPVLVPVTLTVGASESDWVERNRELLDSIGLVVECVAPGRLLVRELPALMAEADAVALTRDVIGHYLRQAKPHLAGEAVMRELARHVNDAGRKAWAEADAAGLVRDIESSRDPLIADDLQAAMRAISGEELRDLVRHGN